jgi:hypothetical protein
MMTVAATMVIVRDRRLHGPGLGVVGLGSFIRFRSSIKDPRDVVLISWPSGPEWLRTRRGAVAATGVGAVWLLLVVLDRTSLPEAAPVPAWEKRRRP